MERVSSRQDGFRCGMCNSSRLTAYISHAHNVHCSEADDLCRAEEEGQQNLFKAQGKDNKQLDEKTLKLKAAFESHSAAIVINSFGVITMANKVSLELQLRTYG